MHRTCPITGLDFEITPEEIALRKKLGVEDLPAYHPIFLFFQLGAFWQHWNLHKRKCGKTGKQIVSVYPEDCPYPVWHKDEWIKHADPPTAEFDPSRPLFPQFQELFFRSPIAHNIGTGNENCEYTDDWWYSKNCYLSHSGLKDEDLRYCYRCISLKNSMYCVFSFESERSVDLINSHNCYNVRFAQNCWQCTDSAFLYDCRGCNNCFLCSNLRNKKFCFQNEQLTEEAYKQKMASWDLRSRQTYVRAIGEYDRMMRERAWHRALFIDRSENVQGNYLDECKNCTNCFLISTGLEDCVNVIRGGDRCKDCLDCVGGPAFQTELVYYSSLPQDQCYDIKFCIDTIQCKWMEYSAHCFQCEHCFGCCGLVGKKYCILNKQYAPEEFEALKAKIIAKMKETGEYGQFFPGNFAASPYDESLAGFHWPLTKEQAKQYGFWVRTEERTKPAEALDPSQIPDSNIDVDQDVTKNVYWDDASKRPFRIESADITICRDLGIPLPHTYYSRRMQENFARIPFDGTLRTVHCGNCQRETQTSWPKEYDGRILCEDCYLKEVY